MTQKWLLIELYCEFEKRAKIFSVLVPFYGPLLHKIGNCGLLAKILTILCRQLVVKLGYHDGIKEYN